MGRSEEGLCPEGREQTKALGKFLQPLGIHQIYTSPLRRAFETSEIIRDHMVWPIVGFGAAFLTMFGFVPQCIKMWETRSVQDVSGMILVQFSTGAALWLSHGCHLKNHIIIGANAISLSTLLVALGLSIELNRHNR